MNRFFISFLVFIIVAAVPPILIIYTGHAAWLVPKFWVMFFFFAMLTLIICTSVIIAQQIAGKSAAQVFLVGTTIKLLACMFFALFYLKSYPVKPISFISSFFYLYLLNTVFEIRTLLSNLRVQNKK